MAKGRRSKSPEVQTDRSNVEPERKRSAHSGDDDFWEPALPSDGVPPRIQATETGIQADTPGPGAGQEPAAGAAATEHAVLRAAHKIQEMPFEIKASVEAMIATTEQEIALQQASLSNESPEAQRNFIDFLSEMLRGLQEIRRCIDQAVSEKGQPRERVFLGKAGEAVDALLEKFAKNFEKHGEAYMHMTCTVGLCASAVWLFGALGLSAAALDVVKSIFKK